MHERAKLIKKMQKTTETNRKVGAPENASKSAVKNRKRKEAASKKKQEGACNETNVTAKSTNINPQPNTSTNITSANSETNLRLTGDTVSDKKLRKLNEKLVSIQNLKEQQKRGKQLEKNQTEKINKENEIIMEIEKLQM